MKNLILLLFLVMIQKNVFSQENVNGKYICQQSQEMIELKDDGSFLILNITKNKSFKELDTISFGNWRYDKSFIILNTPKSIENSELKAYVEEIYDPNSDSLRIEISNPFETDLLKYEFRKREFNYHFFISSYESKFGPDIEMKNNRISLFKNDSDKIVNIYIQIVPDCFLYPSPIAFNVLTVFYIFNNRNANHLKIKIPDFTFNYIGYRRFKDEYVRLENHCLFLRGMKYKKSSR